MLVEGGEREVVVEGTVDLTFQLILSSDENNMGFGIRYAWI